MDLLDEKMFYEYLLPKYAALIEKVDKIQEKEKPSGRTRFMIGNREKHFKFYFEVNGVDSEKWVRIFKERLGIVNKNGIQNLKPKHYEKV